MPILTISVKDKDEKNIRKLAKEVYGKRKGAISMAISKAVEHNLEEIEQKNLREKALQLLEKGFHMGKKLWTTRDELYD